MGRLRKIGLLFSVCFMFFVSGTAAAKTETPKFQELKPNIVEEFSEGSYGCSMTDTPENTIIIPSKDLEQKSTDAILYSEHYFKFTLDCPSRVNVYAWRNFVENGVFVQAPTSDASYYSEYIDYVEYKGGYTGSNSSGKYLSLIGQCSIYLAKDPEEFDSIEMIYLSDGRGPSGYFLGQGTYYMKVKFGILNNEGNMTLLKNMIGKVMLEAMPIADEPVFTGADKNNTKSMIAEKTYKGVLLENSPVHRYQYTATEDATVSIQLEANWERRYDFGGSGRYSSGLYLEVIGEDNSLVSQKCLEGEKVSGEITCNIEKGNNYIVIYPGIYGAFSSFELDSYIMMYSLSVSTSEKKPIKIEKPVKNPEDEKTVLKSPKLLKYQRGTKLLKGKAEDGAEVILRVNGKKYSVNVKDGIFKLKLKKALKKGTVIKVSASLGSEKTKTRTYKVK